MKEVHTLGRLKRDLVLRTNELLHRVSKEDDLDHFYHLVRVTKDRLLQYLSGDKINGGQSIEDLKEFLEESEESIRNLEQHREELWKKYGEQQEEEGGAGDLDQVKEEFGLVRRKMEVVEELVTKCDQTKKEHRTRMKEMMERTRETQEEVKEVERLADEHWKTISLRKGDMWEKCQEEEEEALTCLEEVVRGVTETYDRMMEEVEDLVDKLTGERVRMEEGRKMTKEVTEELEKVKMGLERVRQEMAGEHMSWKSGIQVVERLRERVTSCGDELESKRGMISDQEQVWMKARVKEVKEEVEGYKESVQEDVESLERLVTQVQEAWSQTKEERREEVVKGVLDQVAGAQVHLSMLSLKCLETKEAVTMVQDLLATLDTRLQALVTKRLVLLDLETSLDKVDTLVTEFDLSLEVSSEDELEERSHLQLQDQVRLIQGTLESISVPLDHLSDEEKVTQRLRDTKDKVSTSRNTFWRLIQDSDKEAQDLEALESQMTRALETKSSPGTYGEMKERVNMGRELGALAHMVWKTVEDTRKRLRTKDQRLLSRRCEHMCATMDQRVLTYEEEITRMEEQVRSALEDAKDEHERWLHESMSRLQQYTSETSTSTTRTTLENMEWRTEAICRLEEDLGTTGDKLLDHIHNLEQQMTTMDNDGTRFSTQDSVYMSRKISLLDFKVMVKDSRQIYVEVVARYKKASLMYQELEEVMEEVREQVRERGGMYKEREEDEKEERGGMYKEREEDEKEERGGMYKEREEDESRGMYQEKEEEESGDSSKKEDTKSRGIDYVEQRVVTLKSLKTALDSKRPVMKQLVEMEKQLTMEGFKIHEFNIIEVENNFIRAHEDVHDMLTSLKQTQEVYYQVSTKVQLVKKSVSSLVNQHNEAIYWALDQEDRLRTLDQEDRLQALKELIAKVDDMFGQLSSLKTETNNFDKDYKVMSGLSTEVLDLEKELDEFRDVVDKRISECLEEIEVLRSSIEGCVENLKEELRTMLCDIGRIWTRNLLAMTDSDMEEAVDEINVIQGRLDHCGTMVAELMSECLETFSCKQVMSEEVSKSRKEVQERLEELMEERVNKMKRLRDEVKKVMKLCDTIESEVESMMSLGLSELETCLEEMNPVSESIHTCKRHVETDLVLDQLVTKEEKEYWEEMKEEVMKRLEHMEHTLDLKRTQMKERLMMRDKMSLLEKDVNRLTNMSVDHMDQDLDTRIKELTTLKEQLEDLATGAEEYQDKIQGLCQDVNQTICDLDIRRIFMININKIKCDLEETEIQINEMEELVPGTSREEKEPRLDGLDQRLTMMNHTLQEYIGVENIPEVWTQLSRAVQHQMERVEQIRRAMMESSDQSDLPASTEDMDSSLDTGAESSDEVKDGLEGLLEWLDGQVGSLDNLGSPLSTRINELVDKTALLTQLGSLMRDDLNQTRYLDIKSRFSNYEQQLKEEYEREQDFKRKMEKFSEKVSSALDCMSSNTGLPGIEGDILEDFEEKSVSELRALYSEIIGLEIVSRDPQVSSTITSMLNSVTSKYEHLRHLSNSVSIPPLGQLDQAIVEAEQFINFIFPHWYKNQLTKTIMSSKECMIGITETRMKVSRTQMLSNNVNKLVKLEGLLWPTILQDQVHKEEHQEFTSDPETRDQQHQLYMRHGTIKYSLEQIHSILVTWMDVLQDLKVKWQELTGNEDQFEKWVAEMQSREDVFQEHSVHLNLDWLGAKIYSLQTLRDEIEINSRSFTSEPFIQDLQKVPTIAISTVTFSPETDHGDHALEDTMSHNISAQYLCLAEKILAQIHSWTSIMDKLDTFTKSAQHLKQDFEHLRERVDRLELHAPISVDQWHFLKSQVPPPISNQTTVPTFEVNYSSSSSIYSPRNSLLRNSGSNRGISKLFWPYSHMADHAGGDCETNKLSRSLICLNTDDLRCSLDSSTIRQSYDPSLCCLDSNPINTNNNNNSGKYTFRSEEVHSSFQTSDRSPRSTSRQVVCPSQDFSTVRRLKKITTTTPIHLHTGSSGYRSSTSSLLSSSFGRY